MIRHLPLPGEILRQKKDCTKCREMPWERLVYGFGTEYERM